MGSTPLKIPTSLYDLMKRTELNYDNTLFLDPERPDLRKEIKDYVETIIKYEGYIQKQIAQVDQF